MADIALPYTFVPLSQAKSAEVNADMAALLDGVNKGLPHIPAGLTDLRLSDLLTYNLEYTVQDYAAGGAIINTGAADARSATLAAAGAAGTTGRIRFGPGIYRFDSNTSISVGMLIVGAVLRPAAGVTLTVLGTVEASGAWIDLSLGGTVTFIGNKKLTSLKASWWSFAADRNTDDSALWTALFAAVPQYSIVEIPLGAQYALANTATMTNRDGITIACEGNPANDGPTTGTAHQFVWTGAAGGRLFFFDRCRFITVIGSHYIGRKSGQPTGADVAVDLDGYAPGQIGTGCKFDHCKFEVNGTNAAWVGLRISQTVINNQEYHIVDDCMFQGSGSVGIGSKIGASANAKAIKYTRCSFVELAKGIHQLNGSHSSEHCSFTSNLIDIQIDAATEPCVSYRPNSEHSGQHLVVGSAPMVTLVKGRHSTEVTTAGKGYIQLGAGAYLLEIEGCVFEGGLPVGTFLYDLSLADNAQVSLRRNRTTAITALQHGLSSRHLNCCVESISEVGITGLNRETVAYGFRETKQKTDTLGFIAFTDEAVCGTSGGGAGQRFIGRRMVSRQNGSVGAGSEFVGAQGALGTLSYPLGRAVEAELPAVAGVVPDLECFGILKNAVAGGAITRLYGYRCPALAMAGVTNPRAFWQEGTADKNLFAGRTVQAAPASAPADGDIGAAQISLYLDEAGNNLKVRVRYSDGVTLKTGTLALV